MDFRRHRGFLLDGEHQPEKWAVLFIIRHAYPRREGNSNSTNVSLMISV